MLSKERINQIKQAVNIVDVIGESVALTKNGRNFLGLCPFHGEKTPSFNVVEDKQFYRCFGCGKSGDVFRFIEDYRGISFVDSVAVVAEKAGIVLEQEGVRLSSERAENPHQSLYAIYGAAATFYHALLMTTKMGEAARQYLYNRGLSDQVIKHFQLGLAPKDPTMLYQKLSQDFDQDDLLQSGLFNTSDDNRIYDSFQHRIMFPLADEYGRTVAFSGRIWTQEDQGNSHLAKYKNSRTSPIFNKSYELYHLDRAKAVMKKQGEVYLMEGFLDVIAAHRSGIDNAVASMGTALTSEHARHLATFCKKVVLTYDGDQAGQAATLKALDVLHDFQVEIVSLPDKMDPDELLQKNSEEVLVQALTKSRMSKVEFLIHYLKPDNPDNLQLQIEFVDRIAPIIAQTESITAQNSYIYKVADLLSDFSYEQVEQAVNQARLQERNQRARAPYDSREPQYRPAIVANYERLPSLIRTENHLLYRMVQHPYILNDYRLREDFAFDNPDLERLFELLKERGQLDTVDLYQEAETVQQAWYRMLEERLPEEVGSQELEELERRRANDLLDKENRQIKQVIREHSHVGNSEMALNELEELLNNKRKQME